MGSSLYIIVKGTSTIVPGGNDLDPFTIVAATFFIFILLISAIKKDNVYLSLFIKPI